MKHTGAFPREVTPYDAPDVLIVSGNTTTSTNPTNAVWRGSGTTVRNSLADQDVGGKFATEESALTFVGMRTS